MSEGYFYKQMQGARDLPDPDTNWDVRVSVPCSICGQCVNFALKSDAPMPSRASAIANCGYCRMKREAAATSALSYREQLANLMEPIQGVNEAEVEQRCGSYGLHGGLRYDCLGTPLHGGRHFGPTHASWASSGDVVMWGIVSPKWAEDAIRKRHEGSWGGQATTPPVPVAGDGLCQQVDGTIRCVEKLGHSGYCHTPLGKGFGMAPPDRSNCVTAFGVTLELPSKAECVFARNYRRRPELPAEYKRTDSDMMTHPHERTGVSLDHRIKTSKAVRASSRQKP